jgi:hypothetical protein
MSRFDLLDISKDHAAAIGNVVTNWAIVEGQLANIISYLLRLPPAPSHATTAETSVIQRIHLIKTLVGLTGNQAWIDAWKQLETDLDDLRTRRNDVVHAEWRATGIPDTPHEGIRVKARGRLLITVNLAPTRDILKLASAIASLEEKLSRFVYTLVAGGAPAIIASPNPPGPSPTPSQGHKGSGPAPTRLAKSARKRIRRAKLKNRSS